MTTKKKSTEPPNSEPPNTVQVLLFLTPILSGLGAIFLALLILGCLIGPFTGVLTWIDFLEMLGLVVGLAVCLWILLQAWMDLDRVSDAFHILEQFHNELQRKSPDNLTDAEHNLLLFYFGMPRRSAARFKNGRAD